MSKEKQIEEITEIIRPFVSGLACEEESGTCEFVNCQYCRARDIAQKIYDEVYRKQSEGKWTFGKLGGRDAWVCSLCGTGFTGVNAEWIAKSHDYCPKCGAKMKGGAE